MNKSVMITIGVLATGLCCGCLHSRVEKPDQHRAQDKPAIEYVEDLELAKLILTPPRKELKVARDPFKPLISKGGTYGRPGGEGTAAQGQWIGAGGQNLDVTFIGVVRMDDQFVAYLQTPYKKGAFKVGDRIGSFTIEHITMDRIVFKSGEMEIVRKRGKT